jgi:8-oxo-dGTP diphosphatase
MKKFEYDWPMAALTSTVVACNANPHKGHRFLTVVRKNDPYKGMLCFPGGFVDIASNETVEQAAAREMFEETGISHPASDYRLFAINSTPNRDPRGRVVDFSFSILLSEAEFDSAKAGDDAESVQILTLRKPFSSSAYWDRPLNLAFDHEKVLKEYLKLESNVSSISKQP